MTDELTWTSFFSRIKKAGAGHMQSVPTVEKVSSMPAFRKIQKLDG